MKKLAMICMVIAMAALLCLPATATTGSFLESPSGKKAPVLEKAENEDPECEAKVYITAYADRGNLDEEDRRELESAYTTIIGAPDASDLNALLAEKATALGITVADLAVSDLFDINTTDCHNHDEHGKFHVTISADTLSHFVALLHYNNGAWDIVEAQVDENGDLTFTQDDFSPFAIVISTVDFPKEEEGNYWWIAAVVAGAGSVGGGGWYVATQTQFGANAVASIAKGFSKIFKKK